MSSLSDLQILIIYFPTFVHASFIFLSSLIIQNRLLAQKSLI